MSWAIGFDEKWQRDIGYGVPAYCDHPGCKAEIDRGLPYVCGGEPYGGSNGCGLYFCEKHLTSRLFARSEEQLAIDFELGDDWDTDDIEAIADGSNDNAARINAQCCTQCANDLPPFTPSRERREWIMWKLSDPSWQRWRDEEPWSVIAYRSILAQKHNRRKEHGNANSQSR